MNADICRMCRERYNVSWGDSSGSIIKCPRLDSKGNTCGERLWVFGEKSFRFLIPPHWCLFPVEQMICVDVGESQTKGCHEK